jgi:hypothetical protein
MDVHVRVGVVAGDHGGVAHHGLVHIGVHVQRDADGDVGRDLAQAAQQLALGVLQRLGDHGAVQVQQHGIEAASARRDRMPG